MSCVRIGLSRYLRSASVVVFSVGHAIPPVFAHHAMDFATPQTSLEGFTSGLAHPIIGIDHLAFVIAVGLLASVLGRPFLTAGCFVVGTLAGAGLHLARFDLPYVEAVITCSIIGAAILVFAAPRAPSARLSVVGLVALAGLFHGWAYAESIIGAEAGPLWSYLLGFATMQLAIILTVAAALRGLSMLSSNPMVARTTRQATAGVLVLVGAAALAGQANLL